MCSDLLAWLARCSQWRLTGRRQGHSVAAPADTPPSWTHAGEDMNVLMLEDFLRGVHEGNPAGASATDGLRALEIVLAAYRSGEDHEPRRVEPTAV